ncbi:hypothetical protein CsSME_00022739 [Camellia sinensis var. sinensis]
MGITKVLKTFQPGGSLGGGPPKPSIGPSNLESPSVVTQIRGVASKVKVMKDKIPLLKYSPMSVFGCNIFDSSLKLNVIREEIKAIKVEVIDIYDKICVISVLLQAGKLSIGVPLPSRENNTIVNDEIMVGFEDKAMTIKDQLTGRKK